MSNLSIDAAGGPEKKMKKMATKSEYFPEKRNFDGLWLQAFPVGTEWDLMDAVYQYKWDFSNLEQALEEGGELHNKKVYLFACTEAECLPYKDQLKATMVPVVVAVVSPFPPSDKIVIARKLTDEIVPMKQMKMDWVPYISFENRESQVERLKNSQIFILSCKQRRAGLEHLEDDRLEEFENCIPYFYNPFQEDKKSTVVQLVLRSDPNPVVAKFNWKQNDIEKFADKLIELEELHPNEKVPFMDRATEKIREAEKRSRVARESVKKVWDELDQQSKAIFETIHKDLQFFSKFDWEQDKIEKFADKLIKKEELPADQKEPFKAREESCKKAQEKLDQQSKAAFKNMKFYKFYPVPSPDTPDVSSVKSTFINRYYPKAHKVI